MCAVKRSRPRLCCGQAVKKQKRWSKYFDPGRNCDYSSYGSDHPLLEGHVGVNGGLRTRLVKWCTIPIPAPFPRGTSPKFVQKRALLSLSGKTKREHCHLKTTIYVYMYIKLCACTGCGEIGGKSSRWRRSHTHRSAGASCVLFAPL